MKRYNVELTDEQRADLLRLANDYVRGKQRRGRVSARKMTRTGILFLSDAGLSDSAIAMLLGIDTRSVHQTRRRFTEEGLGAVEDRARPGARRVLGEKGEARLVAEALRKPPGGRWSLRLLARRAVELRLATACSHETVRLVLKKKGVSI